MYLCVRGIVTKPVTSQESDWSCICVLGVSLPSLYQARKVIGHVSVCQGYLYQGRKVSGHVSVCQGYHYQACTKPGKWVVMYLCVRCIVTKPVPSQESEWSCICVLGVSLPSPYQAWKVSGHVSVCQGYRYQACTQPGKWVVMYLCVRGSDFASF